MFFLDAAQDANGSAGQTILFLAGAALITCCSKLALRISLEFSSSK
jgi:hypothetical protein